MHWQALSVILSFLMRKKMKLIFLLQLLFLQKWKNFDIIALYRRASQSIYRCSEHLLSWSFQSLVHLKEWKADILSWYITSHLMWSPNWFVHSHKGSSGKRASSCFFFFPWGLNWLRTLRLNPSNTALGIGFFFVLLYAFVSYGRVISTKGTLFSVAAKFISKALQLLWILSMGKTFLILPVLSMGLQVWQVRNLD